MSKTDIVVTTIFEPAWLSGYLDNLKAFDKVDEVTIRIIADKKTPSSVFKAAAEAVSSGFNIDCPSLAEQESYLKSIGAKEGFVPWNTDNRRNIGFLRALESGADVLISIDDDNYCLPGEDFVGSHSVVGQAPTQQKGCEYAVGAPWYNICQKLDSQVSDDYFARGYPYAARNKQSQARLVALPQDAEKPIVAVNAGLWLDDPDVDAMSRLVQGPRVSSAESGAVILSPETWSPINTQNTALIREAIPAYYYVRMGFPIQGMKIDRFGDILSGYFLQKCAKHLGHSIRFGDPVAEHRRSPHNLFKDLFHELAGMVVVEELLPWLQELQLEGGSYREAYTSLAYELEASVGNFRGFVWDDGGREFLTETASCMRAWLEIVDQIGGAK